MAFEHLTFFEVHVHPGAEDAVAPVTKAKGKKTTTEYTTGSSRRQKFLGLIAVSILVSVLASVAAKRIAGRFSDAEDMDTTDEKATIEIAE